MTLQQNPFYILHVTCDDPRRKITAASEELSFFSDPDQCADAQSVLLTPVKRLQAELDWFLSSETPEIRSSIEAGKPLSTDKLNGVSRLNGTLYNFEIDPSSNIYDIGFSIMDIDNIFSDLSPGDVTAELNLHREKAKFTFVQEQDVRTELNKKRDRIRQIMQAKLDSISVNNYITLISIIGNKCISSSEYSDGPIIADIIDQYALKMSSDLDKLYQNVQSEIDAIRDSSNDADARMRISSLKNSTQKWLRTARPLIQKAEASGMAFEKNVASDIRSLSLELHNVKHQSKIALEIVDSMSDIFSTFPSVSATLKSDANTLRDLIRNEEESAAVLSKFDALKKQCENIKIYPSEITVDQLIDSMHELHRQLKALKLDKDTLLHARENLCYMVRDVAITINNTHGKSSFALKISNALLDEFGDIPDLYAKLSTDTRTLLRNQLLAAPRNTHQETDNATGNSWFGIGIVVLFLLVIFAFSFSMNTSASGGSGKSSSTGTGQGSGKTTTTSTKPTSASKPTTPASTETRFTAAATVGSKVYADIKTIFPSIGIYTQGTVSYKEFVCECTTSSGGSVWVYMTTTAYKRYFDANASTSIYNDYANEVSFTSSKRIHGTVKKAETIMSGLSKDIGTILVIDLSSVGN